MWHDVLGKVTGNDRIELEPLHGLHPRDDDRGRKGVPFLLAVAVEILVPEQTGAVVAGTCRSPAQRFQELLVLAHDGDSAPASPAYDIQDNPDVIGRGTLEGDWLAALVDGVVRVGDLQLLSRLRRKLCGQAKSGA